MTAYEMVACPICGLAPDDPPIDRHPCIYSHFPDPWARGITCLAYGVDCWSRDAFGFVRVHQVLNRGTRRWVRVDETVHELDLKWFGNVCQAALGIEAQLSSANEAAPGPEVDGGCLPGIGAPCASQGAHGQPS